ncbi:MAG TPA: 2-oxo acid dehydrogenase subunit E2 [Streptosporangiaceae bacterium]|nr:2-oxo acid dehydrogenase subunit E2 [Streptosporangiaceae bacterium]
MRGLVQDVTIPALGMAMTGAVLTRWYKEPGETVAAGEAIAEIETDKSAVDLESPADGVLGPHLVAEGDEVPIGAAVTRVLDDAADPGPDEAVPVPGEETTVPYNPDAFPVPADTVPAAAVPASGAAPAARVVSGVSAAGTTFPHARAPHKLSPRKRMLALLAAEAAAKEKAQETERTETVPAPVAVPADGRLTGRTETAPAPAALPADGGLTGRRGAVAQAVAESWRTIPHFAVQREIDASDADACLAAMRAVAPEATYTDLLLRAFALAVGAAAWLAAGGGQPGGGASGDVGLAVATPEGVMMPVVPDVPALAVPALVAARQAAVRRGRDGRLTARDLASGAVGAVSNLGARGVDAFTGIVPAGRRLLLTTGRIAGRPVAVDGRLAVRTTLIATLNVDHRYFDGDRAADVLDAFDREFRALRTWAGEGDQ